MACQWYTGAMGYSDAFDKLYTLTLETPLETEPKYERIGLYICNVLFTEYYRPEPRAGRKCYVGRRDIVVEHICGLTDFEWNELQVAMFNIIQRNTSNGTTSSALTERRFDWVNGLDTIRAFR